MYSYSPSTQPPPYLTFVQCFQGLQISWEADIQAQRTSHLLHQGAWWPKRHGDCDPPPHRPRAFSGRSPLPESGEGDTLRPGQETEAAPGPCPSLLKGSLTLGGGRRRQSLGARSSACGGPAPRLRAGNQAHMARLALFVLAARRSYLRRFLSPRNQQNPKRSLGKMKGAERPGGEGREAAAGGGWHRTGGDRVARGPGPGGSRGAFPAGTGMGGA